jgi:hypothetical protein
MHYYSPFYLQQLLCKGVAQKLSKIKGLLFFLLLQTTTQWQLFDLSVYPFEKMDLASKQPERVKKMSVIFDAWRKEVLSENEVVSGPAK